MDDELDIGVGSRVAGVSDGWQTRRRRHRPLIGAAMLLLAGGVTVLGCGSGDSSTDGSSVPATSADAGTASTAPPTTVAPAAGGEVLVDATATQPGEILLEPVGIEIADPFTDTVAVEPEVAPTASLPELGLPSTTAPLPEGSVGLVRVSGNQPGLYGGTREMAICDPEQLVAFLEANPDKGSAWAAVQGIEPQEIREFVAELTPVLLTRDTRVTNHGFRDGVAQPHQSVLQAGHAVLVDEYGVPRAKCSCGNPLAEPQPVASAPIYVGDPWPGFEGGTIIVVVPDEPVEEFEVVDPLTGVIISIPRRAGEEPQEPETLPVSLDGLYDCGSHEVTRGDETLTSQAFIILQEDGTMYFMSATSGDRLATAMANMGPGTELEVSGTYSIDGAVFAGETFQASSGATWSGFGVVVSPDRIDLDRFDEPCRRVGADPIDPGPVDPAPVEPPAPAESPEFTAEDLATQYLDLLLLDCGVPYSQILSQGGDETSWRFVVPTPMGDLDLTVFVGTGADDVLVQPNNQLAGEIAVECGFYQP